MIAIQDIQSQLKQLENALNAAEILPIETLKNYFDSVTILYYQSLALKDENIVATEESLDKIIETANALIEQYENYYRSHYKISNPEKYNEIRKFEFKISQEVFACYSRLIPVNLDLFSKCDYNAEKTGLEEVTNPNLPERFLFANKHSARTQRFHEENNTFITKERQKKEGSTITVWNFNSIDESEKLHVSTLQEIHKTLLFVEPFLKKQTGVCDESAMLLTLKLFFSGYSVKRLRSSYSNYKHTYVNVLLPGFNPEEMEKLPRCCFIFADAWSPTVGAQFDLHNPFENSLIENRRERVELYYPQVTEKTLSNPEFGNWYIEYYRYLETMFNGLWEGMSPYPLHYHATYNIPEGSGKSKITATITKGETSKTLTAFDTVVSENITSLQPSGYKKENKEKKTISFFGPICEKKPKAKDTSGSELDLSHVEIKSDDSVIDNIMSRFDIRIRF